MEKGEKKRDWLSTTTALLAVAGVIASAIWTVYVYNENQNKDREQRKNTDSLNRDQRERELSKPFRESQLQMCNDIVKSAAELQFQVCVKRFASTKEALEVGRRGATTMMSLRSNALLFGDDTLAAYVQGIEDVIDSYVVTVARDMELVKHLNCFPCADVWLKAISARCSYLVKGWWLKDEPQRAPPDADPRQNEACAAYARFIAP